MNTKFALSILIAAAGFAAAPAFAESPLAAGSSAPEIASVATRSAVQAELVQFKKGANPWSTFYNHVAATPSVASRDAVKAELAQARADGSLGADTGEDSGSFAAVLHKVPAAQTAVRVAGSYKPAL